MKYKQPCNYCNTMIEKGSLFCPFCGRADPFQSGHSEENDNNSQPKGGFEHPPDSDPVKTAKINETGGSKMVLRLTRALALLLTCAIAISMAGCGKTEAPEEDETEGKRTSKPRVTADSDDDDDDDDDDAETGPAVYVDNVDDFIAELGSDKRIVLAPGKYLLPELSYKEQQEAGFWSGYYDGDAPSWDITDNVSWEYVYDGRELTLDGVKNLSIVCEGDEPAELIVEPRYAYVLTFLSCENITIDNIVAGHTDAGDCSGGVYNFTDCDDIEIKNSGLYGCGVEGLTLYGVRNAEITDSEIYECTEDLMYVRESENIKFDRCVFRDTRGGVILSDTRDFIIDNSEFRDNKGYGTLISLNGDSEGVVRNTEFKNNDFDYLRDSDVLTLKNNTYAGNSFDEDEVYEDEVQGYISLYGYVKDVDLINYTVLIDELTYIEAGDRVQMKKYGLKSLEGDYTYYNAEENWVSYSLSENYDDVVLLLHYIDGGNAYWSEYVNFSELARSLEYSNDKRIFAIHGEDYEILRMQEVNIIYPIDYDTTSEMDTWLSLRDDGKIDSDDFVFVHEGDTEMMEKYGYTDADIEDEYITHNEDPQWYYCTLYDDTLYTVIDWEDDEDGISRIVWRTTTDYDTFLEYYSEDDFYHVVYTNDAGVDNEARALSIKQIYVP